MNLTKTILLVTGLAVAAGEMVLLTRFIESGAPVVKNTSTAAQRDLVDQPPIDWIAVQNKVWGYKSQRPTPWTKEEKEEILSEDALNAVLNPTPAANPNKPAAPCGEDCKWVPLWDGAKDTPAEPR